MNKTATKTRGKPVQAISRGREPSTWVARSSWDRRRYLTIKKNMARKIRAVKNNVIAVRK